MRTAVVEEAPSPPLAAAPQPQSLFITVPDTTLPNGTVVPAFAVGQYLCSRSADDMAVVTADGTPWVEINYHDARQACLDAGYQLITELQALAIAHNIAGVAANWTRRAVGKGSLKQGLRDWSVHGAQPGTFTPPKKTQSRWFELSNGERLWDAAGNAYTWVFDDVQGDDAGLVAKPFAADSPSITTAPAPSMKKGMGWYPDAGSDWSGGALIRGGCWGSGSSAGVFDLGNGWPEYGLGNVGFRCTKGL